MIYSAPLYLAHHEMPSKLCAVRTQALFPGRFLEDPERARAALAEVAARVDEVRPLTGPHALSSAQPQWLGVIKVRWRVCSFRFEKGAA